MAQNGGFQRDDGLARGQRFLDLRGDGQIVFQIHMNNSFQMGVQVQGRYACRMLSSRGTLMFGLMVRSCVTAAIPAAMP